MKKFKHNKLTAACLIIKRKHILLIKRKNEPFKGKWSLPAGFVEYGEHPYKAALRELKEETSLVGEVDKYVGMYLTNDHPDTASLLTVITVKVKDYTNLRPGDDASDVKFFSTNKIPKLAFKSHKEVISSLRQL